jgi:hypothetical protein
MTWTIEKPTRPGWYWYRKNEKDTHLLLDVRKIEGQLTATWPNGLSEFIDRMPGEWSGPLERGMSRTSQSPLRPERETESNA